MMEKRIYHLDVIEGARAPREGYEGFRLAKEFRASAKALEAYAFAPHRPIVDDAMIVAAAIEYADHRFRRPGASWSRSIVARVPVYELERWSSPLVMEALHDAVGSVTGDCWSIEFYQREHAVPEPNSGPLPFPSTVEAVLPYSDGLDSRAVMSLVRKELGDRLMPVRLAAQERPRSVLSKAEHFTGVPYSVKVKSKETSGRSRGFKFAMLGGVAAHVVQVERILVPESGQGIFGPIMVPSGHAHADVRNHPLFTQKMSRLLGALFGANFQFEFPRIWSTKGETLKAYVDATADTLWRESRSCWRDQRWCSLDGKRMPCGVCAACLFRRMSVHAAGLSESPDAYITSDLRAASVEAGTSPSFDRLNDAYRSYANSGVLHLEHFAQLDSASRRSVIAHHAALVSGPLQTTVAEANRRLTDLVRRHAEEWNGFLDALGPASFVVRGARG